MARLGPSGGARTLVDGRKPPRLSNFLNARSQYEPSNDSLRRAREKDKE